MIDLQFVGALVRRDLSDYQLDEQDARAIINNRVVTDVYRAMSSKTDSVAGIAGSPAAGLETADANARLATAPALSEAACTLLTQARRRVMVNSLRQASTANQVASILESAGVPALVYKGVAMAVEINGDWRGRQSSDLDLLIAPHSVDAAHEALVSAGLRRRGDVTAAPGRFHRFRAFETGYTGLPVAIDLHWQVESPGYFAIPFDDMWGRRQRISGDGLQVWAPSTAEALLIAAVHGTRESWRSLRHIMDFAQLAARISPEHWLQAKELSRMGPRKSLAIGLAVAELCGVESLPARPGPWALEMAQGYLEPMAAVLAAGDPSRRVVGRSPLHAVERRLRRWRSAPNTWVAFDGLLRSLSRQVGYDGKRSWGVRPANSTPR